MQAIEEAIQTQKNFSQHVSAGLRVAQTELKAFGETAAASTQHALASAVNACAVAQQAISSADNASSVAQQAISSADEAASVAQQAIASADNASAVAQQAMAEARQTRESVVNLEAMLQNLQHLTTIRDQRVNDLLNSTSWRVTAPLRWLSIGMRRAMAAPWRLFKFATRSLLLPPMRLVLGQPRLRQAFSTVLQRFPTVAHHLHLMAINRGVVQAQTTPIAPTPPTEYSAEPVSPETNESTSASDYPLTPHARQILDDLKTAIERNKPADNT
jgi:O-antigen chain-terminating methyltransferase